MEISFFFRPIDTDSFEVKPGGIPQHMGSMVDFYETAFPNWLEADLVLVGVPEDRASLSGQGAAKAPDRIREYFYQLAAPTAAIKVADLGNLAYKEDIDEVYEALKYVITTLLKAGKTVVVLGGSQDICYGVYQGYEALETFVEYTCIDPRPDMLDAEIVLSNHSFNSAIFTHSPNYLFHFACLGTQMHYVTETERKTLKAMNFEAVRLSELNDNIRLAEPHLRHAHMVSMDLSVVRQADAPGTSQPSPAGLSTEQACRLARFAGMGYRTSSFCVTEVVPEDDPGEQTCHLAALIVWYFIEGFYNRVPDEPKADRSNLQCYRATLHGSIHEIIFYRSALTDRWWMEVPSPQALRNNRGPTTLIPCAEADYHMALRNEIPERWWTTHYRYR